MQSTSIIIKLIITICYPSYKSTPIVHTLYRYYFLLYSAYLLHFSNILRKSQESRKFILLCYSNNTNITGKNEMTATLGPFFPYGFLRRVFITTPQAMLTSNLYNWAQQTHCNFTAYWNSKRGGPGPWNIISMKLCKSEQQLFYSE